MIRGGLTAKTRSDLIFSFWLPDFDSRTSVASELVLYAHSVVLLLAVFSPEILSRLGQVNC